MNFYHATNCTRTFEGKGGLAFTFAPYEHVGTWMGVFATEKPDEVAALDEMVAKPKSSITAITADEYANCVAKKKSASTGYSGSLAQSTPTPGVPDANSANASRSIDTNPPTALEQRAEPLGSVDEAVQPVKINRPQKAVKQA